LLSRLASKKVRELLLVALNATDDFPAEDFLSDDAIIEDFLGSDEELPASDEEPESGNQ
jgi:hypothetical protein